MLYVYNINIFYKIKLTIKNNNFDIPLKSFLINLILIIKIYDSFHHQKVYLNLYKKYQFL